MQRNTTAVPAAAGNECSKGCHTCPAFLSTTSLLTHTSYNPCRVKPLSNPTRGCKLNRRPRPSTPHPSSLPVHSTPAATSSPVCVTPATRLPPGWQDSPSAALQQPFSHTHSPHPTATTTHPPPSSPGLPSKCARGLPRPLTGRPPWPAAAAASCPSSPFWPPLLLLLRRRRRPRWPPVGPAPPPAPSGAAQGWRCSATVGVVRR